jgi:hypothetical protein
MSILSTPLTYPRRMTQHNPFQTDKEVWGDRPADRHRRRFHFELNRHTLRLSCEPYYRSVNGKN